MIIAVEHVTLAMPPEQEDRARDFYGRLLGLTEVKRPYALAEQGGVWYSLGAQQLHLDVDENFQANKTACPALLVRDSAIWAKRLREANCAVEWNDDLAAYQRFFSKDPFGNRLEFLEPK